MILNKLTGVKGRADDLVKTVGLGPIQAKIKGERRLLTTDKENKRVGVEFLLRDILISCWHCKTGECSLQGMTFHKFARENYRHAAAIHGAAIYKYINNNIFISLGSIASRSVREKKKGGSYGKRSHSQKDRRYPSNE